MTEVTCKRQPAEENCHTRSKAHTWVNVTLTEVRCRGFVGSQCDQPESLFYKYIFGHWYGWHNVFCKIYLTFLFVSIKVRCNVYKAIPTRSEPAILDTTELKRLILFVGFPEPPRAIRRAIRRAPPEHVEFDSSQRSHYENSKMPRPEISVRCLFRHRRSTCTESISHIEKIATHDCTSVNRFTET